MTHVVKADPSAPPGWKLPSPLTSRQRPIVAPWRGWFDWLPERSPTLRAVMVLPARGSCERAVADGAVGPTGGGYALAVDRAEEPDDGVVTCFEQGCPYGFACEARDLPSVRGGTGARVGRAGRPDLDDAVVAVGVEVGPRERLPVGQRHRGDRGAGKGGAITATQSTHRRGSWGVHGVVPVVSVHSSRKKLKVAAGSAGARTVIVRLQWSPGTPGHPGPR